MLTHRKARSWIAAITALLILLGCTFTALADKMAIVTAQSAAMRTGTKKSSRLLGELPKGTEVTVLKTLDKLVRVKYAGKIGYIKKSALRLLKDKNDKDTAVKPTPTPKVAAETRSTTVRAVAYKEPDKTCRVRVVVRKGTAFQILGETGAFYRVKKGGKQAYILQTAFAKQTPSPTPTPRATETKTTTRDAKLYKQPARASKVLSALDAGTVVEVLDTQKNFARVRVNGRVGYLPVVAFKAVSQNPTPAPTKEPDPVQTPKPDKVGDVNSGKAETVVKAALAQLGKPYVYGKTGPSSFDCSGLTYYAYKTVGVSLAHSAQSVGYGSGTKVTRSQLQRGDIVCFNTVSDNDLSDHVGVYLGGGQFVHASSGQGRVVVNTLTGYYDTAFSWGRRVL